MGTVGDSPSGKAVGSGPTIRGFESLIPSQFDRLRRILRNFYLYIHNSYGKMEV